MLAICGHIHFEDEVTYGGIIESAGKAFREILDY